MSKYFGVAAARRGGKRWSRITAALLVGLAPTVAPAQRSDTARTISDSTARSLIDARVRLMPNAGIIVGLVDAHGSRILSAGTLNGPGTPAPDASTMFEIGSVTKTFTATALADMVRQRQVTLDEPVARLLPDSVHVPSRDGKQITLLDLATQSSALPSLPTNFSPSDVSNPYADYSVAQLYAFLSSYQLPRDPGVRYEYSNLGFGLLGFVLARKDGTSYEAMVHRRITVPLGMNHTRISLSAKDSAHLAPAHNAAGDTVANWDFPTLTGAGAIRSTMGDMLKYLTAYMQKDTTTAFGRDVQLAILPRRPTTIPNMRIGLAWHIRDVGSSQIVWHNGQTGGYHSFVGFDPARGTGVVILGNSATATDDIGFHLLDPSAPIMPPPAPPAHHTAVAMTQAQLQPYAGSYQLAPSVVLTISLRGRMLFAQLTGQSPLPIYAESADHFFLKAVDATLDFERDSAQRVTAVVLHQNGNETRAPRLP
jgi:CubicO group peptidase (beta-lactamase class C family)